MNEMSRNMNDEIKLQNSSIMDEPRRRRGRRPRRIPRAGSTNASLVSCACACLTTSIAWRVDGFVPMPMPMPMPMARPPQPQPASAFSPASDSHASRSNDWALLSSRESTAAERTTYYDVLGVSMYSDTAEIKKQYKRLARMTHPDALIASSSNAANTSNDSGTNSLPDFYEISTAYKVLSDPKKRKKYDRELAADQFVEGTAELAESVSATLGGFVVPFISNTAKATVKAAAKTATVVKNTSDQVQENIRKAREEEAERRRQQKLEEERLRAEVNERMRRKEEERLRLEAERVEQKRVEAERRAEEERIAAANRAKEQRLETECIAEEQRLEADRRATEAAAQKAKAEQKETKAELSELEKKFLQLKADEILEEKKPSQRSETISLSSVAPSPIEKDTDQYSLDKAIRVSIDEHSGGRRSKITKPSSRRKNNAISEKKSHNDDAREEPYDLETALRISKEPRSFGTKKTTAAKNSRRSKKSKRKKGQNRKKKR